ncbi:MAG: class I SAM-dependent methyltransferase [Verrucomicrobiota bacterium]
MTTLVERAHQWLIPAFGRGGLLVDATCGNGKDTLFLCRFAKNGDRVIGLDKQELAIHRTRSLLEENGYRADLFQTNHTEVGKILKTIDSSLIAAAIFNLGYLPRGDHSIVTEPSSTLTAIKALLEQASPVFRLSVVAYRGHPGGIEEEEVVRRFFEELSGAGFSVETESGSESPTAPVFFGLRRSAHIDRC